MRLREAVRDHGRGIAADALENEKVFERHTRLESGCSIQGTGLGLPIVRQIVELHGDGVWAESVMGKGSTFHFTLPLGAAPTPPAAVVDQRAGPPAPRGDEAAR